MNHYRRTILLISFLLLNISGAIGQRVRTTQIQSVIDACVQLRDAAETMDSAALTHCAALFRDEDISTFGTLVSLDESEEVLDGHLIFDQNFADSLAKDSTVLSRAEIFNQTQTVRGRQDKGTIMVKTCFIAANKSRKYRFSSMGGVQELAVVAEAGGRVSMKIHVTNSDGLDMNRNDRKDVRTGRPERKDSFKLPKGKRNVIELEVFNCVDKDISVVIISN